MSANEMYERALQSEGECQSQEWPMWLAQIAIVEQTKRVADALERQNEFLQSLISSADAYHGRPMRALRVISREAHQWAEDRK